MISILPLVCLFQKCFTVCIQKCPRRVEPYVNTKNSVGMVCFQHLLCTPLTTVGAPGWAQLCQIDQAIYSSSAKSGLCAGLGLLRLRPLSFIPPTNRRGKDISVTLNRWSSPCPGFNPQTHTHTGFLSILSNYRESVLAALIRSL